METCQISYKLLESSSNQINTIRTELNGLNNGLVSNLEQFKDYFKCNL